MHDRGSFLLGELVFARCTNLKPWPAVIIKIITNEQSQNDKKEIYKVKFFNHRSTANLYQCDLDKFTQPLAHTYLENYANSTDNEEKSICRAIILALDYKTDKKSKARDQKSKEMANNLNKETKSCVKNKSINEGENIMVSRCQDQKQGFVGSGKKDERSQSEEKQSRFQSKFCNKQVHDDQIKTMRQMSPLQPNQNLLSQIQLCPPSAQLQQKYQSFLQKQSSIIQFQNFHNFKFQPSKQKYMPKTVPSSFQTSLPINKVVQVFQIPKDLELKDKKDFSFGRSSSKLVKSHLKEEVTCPPEEAKNTQHQAQSIKKRSYKQRQQSQLCPPIQGVNQKRRRICKQRKYVQFLHQFTLLHRSFKKDEDFMRDIQWQNKYETIINCSVSIKNDFRLYSTVQIHAFLNKFLNEVLEYLNFEYNNKQYEECHSIEIKCCLVGCLGNVQLESMLRNGCLDKMIAIVDAYGIAGRQQRLNCYAEYMIILRYLDISISMYKASARSFEFSAREKAQLKIIIKLYYNQRKK